MLRIGLTGGIGAGKSTVAATFEECGAIIVDGDVIAREVVEPGTEGLAALVEAFGSGILLEDGALDRPALAKIAFGDDEKRATLNGIVHPLVARRRAELIAKAAQDTENPVIIVEDIPLLVESQMAPLFPLVVIVHADADIRVARLIQHRGMTEADARARIAAQASVEQRQAVADVWLENSGTPGELVAQANELWQKRILPFAHNLQEHRPAASPQQLASADPTWAEQAARIVARLRAACGHRAVRVDHIGSTAVPGLDAEDVIDIQVTVPSLDVADELADPLLAAGYPRVEQVTADTAMSDADDPSLWQKRFHASADPGRPTNVHLRVDGWPNQQFALLFVDWLIANPALWEEYLAVKRAADHPDANEPWFADARRRAWAWAASAGWRA